MLTKDILNSTKHFFHLKLTTQMNHENLFNLLKPIQKTRIKIYKHHKFQRTEKEREVDLECHEEWTYFNKVSLKSYNDIEYLMGRNILAILLLRNQILSCFNQHFIHSRVANRNTCQMFLDLS